LIKTSIAELTTRLLEKQQEDFSVAANNHPLKTYIFKSRAGNLTIEDLRKTLNTPNKVIEIKAILDSK